ncbi:MAG: hypothetical protein ACFE9C_00595 [Candidatus Hodarchaeota archaeon]
MKKLDTLEKRFKTLGLILIILAILLLVIWMILFLDSPEKAHPLLISISIALLMSGILLFTRIQYVSWMKKKY